ncbi:Ankyrin repeat-containing domain protein [Metarhizium album ARSEF 1941]|uniref:Ankyrin repeat-containing domain protein n=1 Tax=Metarhizium album (strain ARSEF 1941) TaxID=1081103 RepID=A0A0B2WKS4_METAS|nr:Ankyrin repeat-containing domain protein [Metarhizium album ARSEF 1941]KHN94548.1 Ankyrin repeat-containing domain protein [Metarhizium album ARSEF 1941]
MDCETLRPTNTWRCRQRSVVLILAKVFQNTAGKVPSLPFFDPAVTTMSITRLPTEICCLILDYVQSENDIIRLALTNRLFSQIATPCYYRRNARQHPKSGGIIHKAAARGRVDILKRAADSGVDVKNFEVALEAARSGKTNVLDFVAESRETPPFTTTELNALVVAASGRPQTDFLRHLLNKFRSSIGIRSLRLCLFRAIAHADKPCAELMLDNGVESASPPAPRPVLDGALGIAVSYPSLEIFEMLLERGANPDRPIIVDAPGRLTIHYAAERPCSGFMKALLKYGADASIPTLDGSTPLLLAIRASCQDTACLLMRETTNHGANMETLLEAIGAGTEEIVKLHLEAGIGVIASGSDPTGYPLHAAAQIERLCAPLLLESRVAILEALIVSSGDVNQRNHVGDSPLHAAVQAESRKGADVLLRHGADVNRLGSKGMSPLHIAALRGLGEIAVALIKYGANITLESQHVKVTALHLACATGGTIIAEELLRFPENKVDAQDLTGRTALFVAAREGDDELVQRLLSRGANPRIGSYSGATPISAAVRLGHVKVVEALLRADPGLIDTTDEVYASRTLFECAQLSDQPYVSRLLERFATNRDPSEPPVGALEFVPADHEYVLAGKRVSGAPILRHCDVCASRVRISAVTRCSSCCGGNFLMCGECSSRAGCLDASHRSVPDIRERQPPLLPITPEEMGYPLPI